MHECTSPDLQKKLHEKGTDRYIDIYTDIATTRKNQAKGRFFENTFCDNEKNPNFF